MNLIIYLFIFSNPIWIRVPDRPLGSGMDVSGPMDVVDTAGDSIRWHYGCPLKGMD